MSNERVTYAELNVAKNSKNQHRKPRGTCSSIPVIEQEIIYADFSFQNPSQEHPRIYRDCRCKGFPSPPEKLIAGTLGIICFVLIVALVVLTTVATPYINHNLLSAQPPCAQCPKEWIYYSHSYYYIGVEKKSWNDSLVTCISKNCSLLYIESEEEKCFLEFLSLVSWARVCQKSRCQPWAQIKDSTFNSKISETCHDERNCTMLTASGLTVENCTALHTYVCKYKLTS
ncbi:NKG2-A/NKG2-B type II integral membrane protein-like isoform X4 [Grammomys surdaster]|uniref:NKG2-A/NKG2-B type II integral membrane protein-like isoform X4 n=1 Tax=Grammomys surdaster TaxID=491861 RepID=UPI00109F5AA7|nr:NKG2-A/NKG2-B type II integral membrane protein-like isoform X4 [Grammomys surdaster]